MNYYQSPASAASIYAVDTTGDSYTLVTGDQNNPLSSGVASVVNYPVAQAIINASSAWNDVSEVAYTNKRSTVLDIIGSSQDLTKYPSRIKAYKLNVEQQDAIGSYVCIIENPIQGSWCEQVTYDPKALEFSILRNNNPTYVQNLVNFLTSGLIAAPAIDFYNEYLPVRQSTTSQLIGSGSTRYFVVQNLVTGRGKLQTQVYGMPRFGDGGGYNLYEKTGDVQNGVKSYSLIDGECVAYCSKKAWLTDVYVDVSGGRPVYSFPRGRVATRGEQFYIDIVSRFI